MSAPSRNSTPIVNFSNHLLRSNHRLIRLLQQLSPASDSLATYLDGDEADIEDYDDLEYLATSTEEDDDTDESDMDDYEDDIRALEQSDDISSYHTDSGTSDEGTHSTAEADVSDTTNIRAQDYATVTPPLSELVGSFVVETSPLSRTNISVISQMSNYSRPRENDDIAVSPISVNGKRRKLSQAVTSPVSRIQEESLGAD